jgi:hypothetical protein
MAAVLTLETLSFRAGAHWEPRHTDLQPKRTISRRCAATIFTED